MLPAPADFDLPRHSHYSGVIPMVFQHSGGRDFDLSRHSHYSGVIPRWCFNIVPLAPVRSLPSSFVRLQQFVCETFQFGPRETSQFVPRYVRCETSSVRSAKSHTQSGRTAKSHKRSGRTGNCEVSQTKWSNCEVSHTKWSNWCEVSQTKWSNCKVSQTKVVEP